MTRLSASGRRRRHLGPVCLAVVLLLGGCSLWEKQLRVQDLAASFPAGAIIAGRGAATVDFDTMVGDLAKVRVVFVGEKHTDPAHHRIQLRILEALLKIHPDLRVGMEMFDHTYQDVLDRWSAGEMQPEAFRRQVHWYANWRHDYALYRDLLAFIRNHRVPLIGLNVPSHIPPKIAIGGTDSLSAEERAHLPERIDTTHAEHRAYIRKIFAQHASLPGRNDFDNFYMAQCVWEDAMAETIADRLGHGRMVVFAGNGHIIRKFGIPQRVHARNAADYRTVYPVAAGGRASSDYADYLWVTPPR